MVDYLKELIQIWRGGLFLCASAAFGIVAYIFLHFRTADSIEIALCLLGLAIVLGGGIFCVKILAKYLKQLKEQK